MFILSVRVVTFCQERSDASKPTDSQNNQRPSLEKVFCLVLSFCLDPTAKHDCCLETHTHMHEDVVDAEHTTRWRCTALSLFTQNLKGNTSMSP